MSYTWNIAVCSDPTALVAALGGPPPWSGRIGPRLRYLVADANGEWIRDVTRPRTAAVVALTAADLAIASQVGDGLLTLYPDRSTAMAAWPDLPWDSLGGIMGGEAL